MSPWSKIERKSECAPDVIGVDAVSRGVAPPYTVSAAFPAFMLVTPAALMLIADPEGSKAKFPGAVNAAPGTGPA